jgi:hypothetical protein
MAAEYESQARRLENRTTLDARRQLDLPFLATAPQRQRRG